MAEADPACHVGQRKERLADSGIRPGGALLLGNGGCLLYGHGCFAERLKAKRLGLLRETPGVGLELLPGMRALEILELVDALPECDHEGLEALAELRLACHRRKNRRAFVSSAHRSRLSEGAPAD